MPPSLAVIAKCIGIAPPAVLCPGETPGQAPDAPHRPGAVGGARGYRPAVCLAAAAVSAASFTSFSSHLTRLMLDGRRAPRMIREGRLRHHHLAPGLAATHGMF